MKKSDHQDKFTNTTTQTKAHMHNVDAKNEVSSQKEYADHYPVMLGEVLSALNIQDGEKYLDCTFGAGGYSNAILKAANCTLTALDRDPSASIYAEQLKSTFVDRFNFVCTNFADYSPVNVKYDGIVLDLGVSSMQLDQAQRGFSFNKDAQLDMRMSKSGFSAYDFINSASENEIADILYKYADEHKSYYIAKAIVEYRKNASINTTLELAEIIRGSKKTNFKHNKIDPATKSFQAIRIHVNQEMQALETLLANSKELLKPGGRLVVVTFHSTEDKIVKDFMRNNSDEKVARSKYAKYVESDDSKWLELKIRRAIMPTKEEIKKNIRSRSAKLRVASKKETNQFSISDFCESGGVNDL